MKTKLGVMIALSILCMAMNTVCFADISGGWTTWVGVYHYTRAQMTATWDASDVFTDSGRQWGDDGTEAISPWLKFNPDNDNGIARTFYGS